jgi:hypothetical protein
LQAFQAGDADLANPEVRRAAERLLERSNVIVPGSAPRPAPAWRKIFAIPRFAQASLAAAAVLAVVGIVLQFRTTIDRPSPSKTNQTGHEVLRSGSFAVLSPMGDVPEAPAKIRWEQVPGAGRYQVRVLEVDSNEMWKVETTQDQVDVPASIRSRIAPAKTLYCEVTAFDSSGNKIGETGLVRFRLAVKR